MVHRLLKSLESSKWNGLIAICTIIGLLITIGISFFSERKPKMRIFASGGSGFTLQSEEAKNLTWKNSPISSIYKLEYFITNDGNRTFTPDDFLSQIVILPKKDLTILSIDSTLFGPGGKKRLEWTSDHVDGSWSLTMGHLNVRESITVNVLLAPAGGKKLDVAEAFDGLRWGGRMNNLDFPEPELLSYQMNFGKDAFVIWYALGILSTYRAGEAWLFFAITIVAFQVILQFLLTKRTLYFRFAFGVAGLLAQFLSLAVADGLMSLMFPTPLTTFWINFSFILLYILFVCLIFNLSKKYLIPKF